MPYRPLLELAATHAYLGEGSLPGSALVPDAATAARLRGLRLIAKPSGSSFTIFGEFDAKNALRVPLTAPVTLRFAIERPAAELLYATDLAALGTASLYTDKGAPAGTPQQLRRQPREEQDDPRPFALVSVQLTPANVKTAITGGPRRCVAALPVATARWCYYLVTDLPNPVAQWRIARGDGASGPAPAFRDAGRAELTAPAADDATGTELRRRNPGLRVLRFLSDAPFAASRSAVRGLELHVGTTRLFGALPNPSPGATIRIGDAAAFNQTLRVVTA
ncbi:hypothetical protein RZN05_00240 [Sphingomonas sp. HF-S4]|uniref:Uncharacterized protein n=1 Tax=Sphingomonas agrestis TaxID=3080540 RepID=A0ABU3Y200_9SPHN|nr:hypothetical protein [Sphingomonas sp. HF-S4]MDV3455394.1 hypothetical protein [Sphingomonas sp. HF-S4]